MRDLLHRRSAPYLGLDVSVRRPLRDEDEVCAESKECRLVFDGLSRIEDGLSAMLVCPASGEMGKPSREALDPNDADYVEVGCLCFVSELVRVVEVCRREPVRSSFGVAVLTICEVALNDSAEVRVEEELPGEAVEERGEAGDSGHEQFSTGTNDPPRLAERLQPLFALGEVVQRPQDHSGVEGLVIRSQLSGVANLCGDLPMPGAQVSSVLDVAGYGIDHVDGVPVFGKPSRMHPGPASDVDDGERSAGQVRADHLLGPHELQLPEPLGDTETFVDLFLVVLRDLFRKLFHRIDGTPPTTHGEHLGAAAVAGYRRDGTFQDVEDGPEAVTSSEPTSETDMSLPLSAPITVDLSA